MTTVHVADGDTVKVDGRATFSVAVSGDTVSWRGIPWATEFRLPMQNLKLAWYEATRRYGPYNYHPTYCEDWNTEAGGNTDLGEPLVAPFSGVVLSARNWGGKIGRVVQIIGFAPEGEVIVWAGWHLHEMWVQSGDIVEVGQPTCSIGNADGVYSAHLHEQICIMNKYGVPAPNTFASHRRYDWQQPSKFYIAHGVDPALVRRCTEYDR